MTFKKREMWYKQDTVLGGILEGKRYKERKSDQMKRIYNFEGEKIGQKTVLKRQVLKNR